VGGVEDGDTQPHGQRNTEASANSAVADAEPNGVWRSSMRVLKGWSGGGERPTISSAPESCRRGACGGPSCGESEFADIKSTLPLTVPRFIGSRFLMRANEKMTNCPKGMSELTTRTLTKSFTSIEPCTLMFLIKKLHRRQIKTPRLQSQSHMARLAPLMLTSLPHEPSLT
jgi:hypothetical protein